VSIDKILSLIIRFCKLPEPDTTSIGCSFQNTVKLLLALLEQSEREIPEREGTLGSLQLGLNFNGFYTAA